MPAGSTWDRCPIQGYQNINATTCSCVTGIALLVDIRRHEACGLARSNPKSQQQTPVAADIETERPLWKDFFRASQKCPHSSKR
jgi:hypothetical protein